MEFLGMPWLSMWLYMLCLAKTSSRSLQIVENSRAYFYPYAGTYGVGGGGVSRLRTPPLALCFVCVFFALFCFCCCYCCVCFFSLACQRGRFCLRIYPYPVYRKLYVLRKKRCRSPHSSPPPPPPPHAHTL